MFKIGDEVKITRKGTKEETEYYQWLPQMDSAIGKTGVVIEIISGYCRLVVGDINENWWYPTPCLKLLSDAPQEEVLNDAEPTFFLVWNPEGREPPRYRHYTEHSAQQEAMRLAAEHHGQEFFVLKAKGRACSTAVIYEELTGLADDDEIPF